MDRVCRLLIASGAVPRTMRAMVASGTWVEFDPGWACTELAPDALAMTLVEVRICEALTPGRRNAASADGSVRNRGSASSTTRYWFAWP